MGGTKDVAPELGLRLAAALSSFWFTRGFIREGRARLTAAMARFAGRLGQGLRAEADRGRPYGFTTATRLLDDFWREVKRVMAEKGIPNDL